ncbi:6-phosphogluconolactonase [Terriglobus saanensis]|uniref:Glucosamine-6-phosphate deaminase n=1 Tax=Terriglobus saanensis (strain ATCC BAA-1853 / DSM 23119 / SP1PR4) TaxID=401053 RepID=E8V2M9_TERSS|nr:6-phosphogluconolactonase [Terriglobus saanensis]ADV83504.1 Glucosamine-6-phosphate deaminase [Terriglobus saanensis SP1PR4]
MSIEATQVRYGKVGEMRVEVHPTREAMGAAAALATAKEILRFGKVGKIVSVIFATGASQLATLDALTRIEGLPWQQVVGFHMDEYVGLPMEHPASFRGYLRRNLTQKVGMQKFFEIDGTAANLEEVCATYAKEMRSIPPQICMVGIGENGHLAFNDPGVADFSDPLDVKVVPLDATCRIQQTAEGWFANPAEVPAEAISITIPTILRVPTLIVSVPGSRKASIVRRTLEEPISTACPATILREHPGTVLYLDEEAAAEIGNYLSVD